MSPAKEPLPSVEDDPLEPDEDDEPEEESYEEAVLDERSSPSAALTSPPSPQATISVAAAATASDRTALPHRTTTPSSTDHRRPERYEVSVSGGMARTRHLPVAHALGRLPASTSPRDLLTRSGDPLASRTERR
jgi:hypothetical protein